MQTVSASVTAAADGVSMYLIPKLVISVVHSSYGFYCTAYLLHYTGALNCGVLRKQTL